MNALKEIRMVDLKTQYLRLQSEIDMAMAEVIHSTNFIKGPQLKKFEDNLADYLGAKHVIGCANGTETGYYHHYFFFSIGLRSTEKLQTRRPCYLSATRYNLQRKGIYQVPES